MTRYQREMRSGRWWSTQFDPLEGPRPRRFTNPIRTETEEFTMAQIDYRTLHAGWRALHSYVVDALLFQEPHLIEEIMTITEWDGSCEAFVNSIRKGESVRVRSSLNDHGVMQYVVELLLPAGWRVLTRQNVEYLGIDPTVAEIMEGKSWDQQMMRDLGVSE
jgi:hypothetical protein